MEEIEDYLINEGDWAYSILGEVIRQAKREILSIHKKIRVYKDTIKRTKNKNRVKFIKEKIKYLDLQYIQAYDFIFKGKILDRFIDRFGIMELEPSYVRRKIKEEIDNERIIGRSFRKSC